MRTQLQSLFCSAAEIDRSRSFCHFPTSKLQGAGTASGSSSGINGHSSSAGTSAAVDMRPLVGQPNTYVVCFPGLHSADKATRQLSRGLAVAMGGARVKLGVGHDAAVTHPMWCSLAMRVAHA